MNNGQPEVTAPEAIRSLVARIAHAADEGDVDTYADLYTSDAVWEMAGKPANVGLTAIQSATRERRAAGTSGPGTATRHITSCVAVTVDSPDEAHAESVWQFFADTATAPRLTAIGRYSDTFRRVDGRWLLARRTIAVG
ncbi:nuclear transport factor 2 family protein [Rhodococcus sp. NPDC058514]|uniref:nuclear transport factor 2 family protein n=1 Tax=unclassified Rhodococcus (in: high G+C Gram-positive bacteria) TaxID=192944 RepID=UPI00365F1AA6